MKPGDLVMFSPPTIETNQARLIDRYCGKLCLIFGFAHEQQRFHHYYRLWDVLIDGSVRRIQGMNLVVINETG